MTTSKIICIVLSFTVIMIIISGCKVKNKESKGEMGEQVSSTITQTKDYPVEIQIDDELYTILEKPKKIAVLSVDIAEMLVEMALESSIVALGEGCTEILGLLEKPICGNPQSVDIDKLREIQPNIILVSSPMRPEQMEPLLEMSIQIIQLPQVESFDEIYSRMEIINKIMYGEVLGTQKAEKAIAEYQTKYDDIVAPLKSYTSSIVSKKKAVYLGFIPYTMATGDTFEGMLLDNIQVDNLGASGTGWFFDRGENIIEAEIIFYDNTIAPEDIFNHDRYKDSPAVMFQQTYAVDFAKIRRKNLAMLDELKRMAENAYPEAMSAGYTVGAE